jgi:hypothetical protein
MVGGLDAPTHLAPAPGEPRRRSIVEKDGRILVLVQGKLCDGDAYRLAPAQ